MTMNAAFLPGVGWVCGRPTIMQYTRAAGFFRGLAIHASVHGDWRKQRHMLVEAERFESAARRLTWAAGAK
jgi:hypothetical protein